MKFLKGLVRFLTKSAVALGLFFLAAALSGYFAVMRTLSGEERITPDLVSHTREVAEVMLQEKRLHLEVSDERFHIEREAGEVISQEPPAGRRVKAGSRVRVILSKGRVQREMPDLAGQGLTKARTALAQNEFEVARVSRIRSSRPAGEVLSHSPRAGVNLAPGASVSLLVSSGPRGTTFVMPELRGADADQVRRTLTALGLPLDEVTQTRGMAAVGGDRVVGQNPLPGHPVSQDTGVRLVISKEQ